MKPPRLMSIALFLMVLFQNCSSPHAFLICIDLVGGLQSRRPVVSEWLSELYVISPCFIPTKFAAYLLACLGFLVCSLSDHIPATLGLWDICR